MTDHKEEQENEIEALESIYPDEIKILSSSPFHCFEIEVSSQCSVEGAQNASCVLQITYTATYPDEIPVIEITSFDGIDEEHIDTLLEFIKEQAEENLGMAMVFTLVSGAQERLTDLVEQIEKDRQEEEERKLKEKEEAEAKRLEGTRVTIESFLAWKNKFDEEMAAKKQKVKLNSKLTGKELFMTDSTLDDSDVKFLEEEGESVQVDESLFQDLDDLDLQDELDLDDDFGATANES